MSRSWDVALFFAAALLLGVARLPLDLPYAGPVGSIAVDPRNPSTIVVASQGGGLFESNDGGSRWHHDDGLPSTRLNDVAYLPNGSLLVATRRGYYVGASGIWLRERPSLRWRRLFDKCDGQGIVIHAPVAYAATACGLAATTDGTHWNVRSARPLLSIAVLDGERLIGGSATGFWFSRDGGKTWSRERSGIGIAGSVRAVAADPRGGGRAYAFTAGNRLYFTRDGGMHWRNVGVDAGNFSCGGRPFVKARAVENAVELYVGTRCDTWVASFSASREASGELLAWTKLEGTHVDTQDIVFPSSGRGRWYMSSDGGVDSSADGRAFARAAGPREGLDAQEITSLILPENVAGSLPDLYLATWHDRLWALRGMEPVGSVRWEGYGLEVRADRATFALCGGCSNRQSDARFNNIKPFANAMHGTRPPVPFGEDGDVQQDATGLAVTHDGGTTWSHVETIDAPMHDRPRVAGRRFVQAVQLGTYSSGMERVGLAGAAMRGFGSLGVMPTSFAWFEVFGVSSTDPLRIIAPDVQSDDVKISTDGGDSWRPIAGLTALVSHDGSYRMAIQAADRGAPLVSVVSFCPTNGSAVAIGTRESGVFVSTDAGELWSRAPGSDGVQNATSIAWPRDCRQAYIGTYGRGVWSVPVPLVTANAAPLGGAAQGPRTPAHVHPPFTIVSGIVQAGERAIMPEQPLVVQFERPIDEASFAIDGRPVSGDSTFLPPNGNWPLGHHYVTLMRGKRALWSTGFIVP